MTAPLHRAAAVMRAFLAICLLSPVAVFGACGSDAPTPPTGQPAVAESLAVLSVDTPQVVGEGVEVRVRVTNLRGRPVPNEAVEWAVVNGTGSVSPSTSSTNADGVAASTWTFGSLVVHYRLAARVADLAPVEFASTPRAGKAEYVHLSTDSIHLAAPGEILRVLVSAADSFDNAVLRAPHWASTDGTVAIVDEQGDVHAVGFGTAWIHASLDGVTDTARVIVAPHEGAHATLAYIHPDGPYTRRIIALDTVLDRRHTVYERIGDQPFLLDWSPDGTRMAFAGTNPAPHLSVVDVSTRRVIRLGGIPQDALGGKLAWSPLGDRIAYLVRTSMPNVELRVVAPDGSDPLRLPGDGVDMSWSPQGDLVYLRRVSGSALPELWQLRRQRTQPEQIAVDASLIAGADAVRVSPDGTRILLFDGRGPLLLLDRSGALLRAIDVGDVVDAHWLPDGRIVFAQRSYSPLAHRIFRVAPDGSDLAPMTDETFAFISDLDVNADGSLLFRSFDDLVAVDPSGASTVVEQGQLLSPRWGH